MKRQQPSSSAAEDSEQKKAKSSHQSSSIPLDSRKEYLDEDRHEGSFPLEEVQAMEEYSRRMTQPPSTKRKYALAVAYCGTNYHGLQVNPGAITVEAILERALLLCGAIQECNYGHLQKISWTRAARTDKGVHAVGQCCSMKLEFPEAQSELFLEQLNSFLPADIRVLAVTRTTKSFNARIHCSHRRYEYLLPSYLLMPEEAVADLFRAHSTAAERHRALSEFRMPDETLTRLRAVLQLYQGTHYYHNFTSDKGKGSGATAEAESGGKGKMKGDPTMMRYMMSLAVEPCEVSSEPQEAAGVGLRAEWLKITILGQSFLLNQVCSVLGAPSLSVVYLPLSLSLSLPLSLSPRSSD
jgi:tRNA pseudouridine38-40 synthase